MIATRAAPAAVRRARSDMAAAPRVKRGRSRRRPRMPDSIRGGSGQRAVGSGRLVEILAVPIAPGAGMGATGLWPAPDRSPAALPYYLRLAFGPVTDHLRTTYGPLKDHFLPPRKP